MIPVPKTNEKGEFISWSQQSDDGKLLQTLVANGNIKPQMTPKDVRAKYSMFMAHQRQYSTFSSALANTRKSLASEALAREPQDGFTPNALKAYSNLQDDDEEDLDDDTYQQFSKMSADEDNMTQWTKWSNANPKSVTFGSSRSVPRPSAVTDVVKSFGGGGGSPPRQSSSSKHPRPLTCVLPHVVDYWYDNKKFQHRASVQIHLLSMDSTMIDRCTYRVSSEKNAFIVTLPVSTQAPWTWK
jgi:hypothetical protein